MEACEAPSVMLVWLSVQEAPDAGLTVEAKDTIPVKLLSGATVTVEVAVAPVRAFTLGGLAEIE